MRYDEGGILPRGVEVTRTDPRAEIVLSVEHCEKVAAWLRSD
jgi:hypothetical protein